MFYYFWKKNTLKKFTSLQNKILNLKKKTNLLTDEQLQSKFNYYDVKLINIPK